MGDEPMATAFGGRVEMGADAAARPRFRDPLHCIERRWGISGGGEVAMIDLGDAALIVPGGVALARNELRNVLRDRYDDAVANIDDPDLISKCHRPRFGLSSMTGS